jgi:hypothetical protein
LLTDQTPSSAASALELAITASAIIAARHIPLILSIGSSALPTVQCRELQEMFHISIMAAADRPRMA